MKFETVLIASLISHRENSLPHLDFFSGRFVDGDILRMYACEQIIVKSKDGKPLGVVLEWNEVPNDLRKKLSGGNV